MKKINLFIFTIFLILTMFFFGSLVKAFEPEELEDCILNASKNPSIEGVSKNSIQNYCECALDLIVDQRKDIRTSGYECAKKSFSWLVYRYWSNYRSTIKVEVTANEFIKV